MDIREVISVYTLSEFVSCTCSSAHLPRGGCSAGRGEFSTLAEDCNYGGGQRKETSGHAPLPLIEGNDSSGLQSNTGDLVLIN